MRRNRKRGEEVQFEVSSLFGLMTGRGLVNICYAGETSQVAPDDARTMGLLLIGAAEAAELDEAFVYAVTERGMSREDAGLMLQAIRDARRDGRDE